MRSKTAVSKTYFEMRLQFNYMKNNACIPASVVILACQVEAASAAAVC